MNIISGIMLFSVAYLVVVTILFEINSSKAPSRIGIISFLMLVGLIFAPSLFGAIV